MYSYTEGIIKVQVGLDISILTFDIRFSICIIFIVFAVDGEGPAFMLMKRNDLLIQYTTTTATDASMTFFRWS